MVASGLSSRDREKLEHQVVELALRNPDRDGVPAGIDRVGGVFGDYFGCGKVAPLGGD